MVEFTPSLPHIPHCVLDQWRMLLSAECVHHNNAVHVVIVYREQGIKYRRDEAVGGWFSTIGNMHQVYHLWGELSSHTCTCLCTTMYFRHTHGNI